MNVISFSEGYIHLREALELEHKDTDLALRKLRSAICLFEAVLDTNATDNRTLRECAEALLLVNKILKRDRRRQSLTTEMQETNDVLRAEEYLKRAISLCPRDATSRVVLAQHYTQSGKNEQAEELFLDALEINAFNATALLHYSNFLHSIGGVEAAQQFKHFSMLVAKESRNSQ
eukprot:TRINITY_DN1522_c1_g1_i5.p1 TRINITY_DN1522_c1_g1~~TRINITY_DN1522_c1_g1_i5.p1  ORF type:complete len:175 (+),score=54.17 TRINITY_DN1522_c1_g1_i5:389-913(+)